jgi:hypothetical protein
MHPVSMLSLKEPRNGYLPVLYRLFRRHIYVLVVYLVALYPPLTIRFYNTRLRGVGVMLWCRLYSEFVL